MRAADIAAPQVPFQAAFSSKTQNGLWLPQGGHLRRYRAWSQYPSSALRRDILPTARKRFAATIGALKILKVFMAKKAPVVAATPPEAVRTKPLPIPDTPFKTIWQVVGTPPAAAKAKGEKTAVAA